MTTIREPNLTNPKEVQETIKGLKFSKATGPKSIPKRHLKQLPQRAVSLLVQLFNAVVRTHHFPAVWKIARGISIPKPGKDPALPSFKQPISLLDTISNLFENVLLNGILHEISRRELMRDEQIGFKPRHSTSMQLPHPVESITTNLAKRG